MKHLKTFESWGMSTKDEMLDYLCKCGWSMEELSTMTEQELEIMCNESSPMEESMGMDKEDMMEYLCRCGYPLRDLMSMGEEQLHNMCMETGKQSMTEKKGEKWMQKVTSSKKFKKGALRETAKRKGLIKGDEKLSMTDIKKLEKSTNKKTAARARLAEKFKKAND